MMIILCDTIHCRCVHVLILAWMICPTNAQPRWQHATCFGRNFSMNFCMSFSSWFFHYSFWQHINWDVVNTSYWFMVCCTCYNICYLLMVLLLVAMLLISVTIGANFSSLFRNSYPIVQSHHHLTLCRHWDLFVRWDSYCGPSESLVQWAEDVWLASLN